jgi:hypothetical protein
LGVLEERPADAETSEDDSGTDDYDDDTGSGKRESNVLGKLMGQDRVRRGPVQIEEVGEG